MNELLDQIFLEARNAWRFRWLAFAGATAICIAGWLYVFAMPDQYEASASVFVDTRTALKPVLQGLAVDDDVTSQLNYARQSLLSGSQLEKIATESGVLRPTVSDPKRRAAILQALADAVLLQVRNAGGRDDRDIGGSVYTISYSDRDRARGLKVVEVALDTLISETLGGKRESTEGAQRFLEGQIKTYEERLRSAEDRLAEFKKNNIGLMPTEQGGYFAQLQVETDAAKRIENDLNVAGVRRAELVRQLRGESVINASLAGTPVVGGAAGAPIGDTATRIKEAQARLDELLLRFTDRHPDVIAARSALKELQRRRDAEVEGLRRGDAAAIATSGVSSNPVYQSIQLALNQVDVEIASLRGQLSQHQAKAFELRKRLDTAPAVEAKFAQLNRDYDVNKAQYTALLANYEKARMGEQAGSAGSIRFEIVQPPTVSYVPVSPHRASLLGGVLFLGLAAGCGLAYLLSVLRPVINTERGLAELTGLRVLGWVGPAYPERLRQQFRQNILHFGAAVAGLVVAFVIAYGLSVAGIRLAFFSS
jgi:polysaccharide chain length determinant protein (PEP-CTERM system associated)